MKEKVFFFVNLDYKILPKFCDHCKNNCQNIDYCKSINKDHMNIVDVEAKIKRTQIRQEHRKVNSKATKIVDTGYNFE